MNLDKEVRAMVRSEIQHAIAPLQAAVDELRGQGELIARLTAAFGGGGAARRRPGRPAKVGGGAGKKRGPRGEAKACAVLGCKRPMRSKGYCSSHYQKRRMLVETKRLPSDWKEDAAPGTVKDMVLPRGRAGAKALAEAKGK